MGASEDDPASPAELATSAGVEIARRTGIDRHDVAVVLGSGWAPAAAVMGPAGSEIDVRELPGFPEPHVLGHAGLVRSVRVGDRHALVFLGRTHLYEGLGEAAVVHPVRAAVAAGVRTVVLTNAAGGVRESLYVGEPVLISDHLNLTARSPLSGGAFVDLTDLYSVRLRGLAREIDPSLTDGVYAALPGPHFETPAEIRMLRTMGADLVGMSTALEAIAARAAGVEVMGISLVTNLAAGVTGEPLNHVEVLEAGRAAARRMGELLTAMVGRA